MRSLPLVDLRGSRWTILPISTHRSSRLSPASSVLSALLSALPKDSLRSTLVDSIPSSSSRVLPPIELNLDFTQSDKRPVLNLDVRLYHSREHYLSQNKSDALASFKYNLKSNSRWIGRIELNKHSPELTMDIIYEAMHAGFQACRLFGRSIPERYEEQVVRTSSELAKELLDILAPQDFSI